MGCFRVSELIMGINKETMKVLSRLADIPIQFGLTVDVNSIHRPGVSGRI
jgi:hypothetical protein